MVLRPRQEQDFEELRPRQDLDHCVLRPSQNQDFKGCETKRRAGLCGV